MKVSILGAAGAMGRATVAALMRRGASVRVVGRSRSKLEAAYGGLGAAVEVVAADLTTREGNEAALRGADAAVYTLGVPYSARAFEAYPPMMEVCLAAARAVGLERLLLVTNVYPYGHPQAPRVDEHHPRNPCSRKGELRKIQEDLLLGAHGPDLLTASIRFPDFYGPHAELSLTHTIFEAASTGRVADLIGPVDVPHEYLYVPDGGEVLTRFVLQEQGWGRGWNCGGVGTLTQRQFTEQVFAAFGAKPKVRVAGPFMLRLLSLFVPILREMIEMRYLLAEPFVLDDTALTALLAPTGALPKTPYAEGIAATAAWMKARG
jgi:nucleoside-diphosphate-sugar epimerase